MRVIIIGAGEVGFQIARFLCVEGIEVVVIDKDKGKLNRITEELDVATIEGEGGDISVMKEAEADKADILLAVTNSDETNMIACLLAKAMFNIPRKIARLRNPSYFYNKSLLSKENLDINPAINPELETATAIIRLIEVPFAADVEDFEDGTIKVIGLKVTEKNHLIGKSLRELGALTPKKILIGLIERGDKAIIPSGNDVIKEGDVIYFPMEKKELTDIAGLLGVPTRPAKKVMILGGGKIGYHIATTLEHKADIKIIEKNAERCEYLSKYLGRSLILHGDGADQRLLLEENIGNMDIFVAVSNNEELNIMASLLAKRLGVKNSITLVIKTDYIPLAHGLGLQAVLSPLLITASSILRYVRRGEVLSLTEIAEGKAEIIEAKVRKTSPLIRNALKDARLPKNSLICAIIKGKEMVIPSGTDVIQDADKLIIFALRDAIKEVERLIQ